MTAPAARAVRIDQRVTDLRRHLGPAALEEGTELRRWLNDIEEEARGLLEDAARVSVLEAEVAGLRLELVNVDQDRQLLADAASMLIDKRRGA